MKRVVCAVKDSATGLFGQPFYVAALGAALRSFTDEVNRGAADNQLAQHPEDFELHHLSDYDDESGVFSVPEGGSRMVARGKDVKHG